MTTTNKPRRKPKNTLEELEAMDTEMLYPLDIEKVVDIPHSTIGWMVKNHPERIPYDFVIKGVREGLKGAHVVFPKRRFVAYMRGEIPARAGYMKENENGR